MSSLGRLIRKARLAKGLTFSQVAREIKIKEPCLKAIEKENWSFFTTEVVAVRGFVQSYASFLGLDLERIMALFKRDFPVRNKPQKKSDSAGFCWTPQATAVLTVALFVIGLVVYLLWQYFSLKTTPYS